MQSEEYWDPKIELMQRGELENLQLKRLKYQLRRCYERSAFFRLKFKRAGVQPDDIKKLDDLSKVPFLFKGELREEQRRYGVNRYIIETKNLREAYPTSGTTGAPVLSFWTDNDKEYIIDVTARTLWSMGLRGEHKVQNAFTYELWAAGFSIHYAVQKIGGFVLPIGSGKTTLQVKYLIELAPDVLVTTPSLALRIGSRLQELGFDASDLSLKFGAFGGEPGTAIPSTRRRIEGMLGIEAYDYFGMAEIAPSFASECKEKAGLHWSEDYHLIEVIDPKTGERVEEGEKGVLVITHLVKEATPMIRYWTGDITKLEYEKCACGRTHVRSPQGILGRTDDMVIYQGISFYPSEVEEILREFPELGPEYKIYFENGGMGGSSKCVVEVEYNKDLHIEDPSKLQEIISERLYDSLGVWLHVRIVDKLLTPYVGSKIRRVYH
ncbi:MAG: AMP-binding protein [Archaeoglobus sp.]|nr:AMP-binding protein [Archaeoglobus sp.]